MKKDNKLIFITNLDTKESRWFTKDSYVQQWIGCSTSSLPMIKANTSAKYSNWKYEIKEAGKIKWEDINII